MVDRQEVEALLHNVALTADENKCQPADVAFEVEGDTLAALCRAWLAVEDAPSVEVRECFGTPGSPYLDTDGMDAALAKLRPGQRVRIVKEGE